jgi:RNA polymerase sigma-70 factor, ECF subfamily
MIRFGKTDREFETVYQDYSGSIHRTLLGMTGNHSVAEELTQETFIKAWKGLPQFGFRSSLKTWIFQVAVNVGRDWLRSHKTLTLISDAEEHEENVNTSEQAAIREALLVMDEDSRTVIILFYWEGLKQDEMSRILNIPEGTVKSRLFTAKTRLREILLMKGFDV